MAMRDTSLRKPVSGLLVLAFALFGLVQGAEIFHSLEEERHLPHHGHPGTVYHEQLPCESGEHHSHFCLHTQQSTSALQYWQDLASVELDLASLVKLYGVAIVESSLDVIRAPPPFS